MNVGSLFSGIGGLDLGLERAGMTVRWQSEVDPYACRVLAKHWPHVPNLGDVTTIDWSTVEPVDLICGGYPCQPFSLAGARAGTADRRHLWPYFAGALRHLRPRWALLENVPGHLSLGFGRVLGDLAELGFDAEWQCIPAAAVGAPHLRWRVFVVAHADGEGEPGITIDALTRSGVVVSDADRDGHGRTQDGPRVGRVDGGDEGTPRQRERSRPIIVDRGETVADADPARCPHVQGRSTQPERAGRGATTGGGWWDVEPDVGRTVDGFSRWLDGPGEPHLLDLAYGNGEEGRSREALRDLLGSAGAEQVGEWAIGGSGGVPPSPVLLAYVRQLAAHIGQEGHASLAGPAVEGVGVRGLWSDEEPARAPRGWGAVEQRPDESSDVVRALPQLLARAAEAAWSAYRRQGAPPALNAWAPGWEHGIARVADGVPSRVQRLRALGNAVVPQVAQLVGERIMRAAA